MNRGGLNGDFEFSPFCQFSVSLATSKLSFLQAHACAKTSLAVILCKLVVATQVPFTRLPVPQSEAYEHRSVWQWNNMTWHVHRFKRENIKAPRQTIAKKYQKNIDSTLLPIALFQKTQTQVLTNSRLFRRWCKYHEISWAFASGGAQCWNPVSRPNSIKYFGHHWLHSSWTWVRRRATTLPRQARRSMKIPLAFQSHLQPLAKVRRDSWWDWLLCHGSNRKTHCLCCRC
jgi:hypothetical protein